MARWTGHLLPSAMALASLWTEHQAAATVPSQAASCSLDFLRRLTIRFLLQPAVFPTP
jgi:hypothetical protein